MSPLLSELYDLVRSIPPGRCATYGAIGRALSNPVSGFLVGKWMASSPPDVPWQRVVGSRGVLLTGKRDPALGATQERLLHSEGVEFTDDGRVELAGCYWEV